jgi:nitroreductase
MTDFDLATVDRLLSTTRAVRRRLDLERPVGREVILDCIRLSQQAPTGTNSQRWRWLVLDDPERRRAMGELYARTLPLIDAASKAASDPQTERVYRDARDLAMRLHEVPMLVVPCVEGRIGADAAWVDLTTWFGSIYQAVWSFQLALRSRGLGSCFTTAHLAFEDESREILGLPPEISQVALLPVAYTRGLDFKPTRRPPPETITHFNTWGDTAAA